MADDVLKDAIDPKTYGVPAGLAGVTEATRG